MQTGYAIAPGKSVAQGLAFATSDDTRDEALIERIATGDRRAMQALFNRHNVRVYRFIVRLTGQESLAEELTSEVFFQAWRQAGRFEGRSKVSTWLMAIARFKAISALRQRQEGELDEHAVAQIEDTADNPEQAMQRKDASAVLRRCLTRLSPAHREIIDLVYYHEKSIEEAVEIIGVPKNTIKTRMFYARRQLAELLQAEGISHVLS